VETELDPDGITVMADNECRGCNGLTMIGFDKRITARIAFDNNYHVAVPDDPDLWQAVLTITSGDYETVRLFMDRENLGNLRDLIAEFLDGEGEEDTASSSPDENTVTADEIDFSKLLGPTEGEVVP
jgi:hypothetical protein